MLVTTGVTPLDTVTVLGMLATIIGMLVITASDSGCDYHHCRRVISPWHLRSRHTQQGLPIVAPSLD